MSVRRERELCLSVHISLLPCLSRMWPLYCTEPFPAFPCPFFFPYLTFPVLTVALYSENKNSSPTKLSNLIPFLPLLLWETLLDFFKTENMYFPCLFRQAHFVCRNLVNRYVSFCTFIILQGLCVENNLSELEEDCPICLKMSHFLSSASH